MKWELEYGACRWWVLLNRTRVAGPFWSRKEAYEAMMEEQDS